MYALPDFRPKTFIYPGCVKVLTILYRLFAHFFQQTRKRDFLNPAAMKAQIPNVLRTVWKFNTG